MMKMRSSPRLAERTKIPPMPAMSSSKQLAKPDGETGSARRKLLLGDEPDGDDDTSENDVHVELPPPPPLPVTEYELGRIQRMKENDAVYKSLGLPGLVADKGKQAEEIKKRQNKDRCPEEGDEYIPENEGKDHNDDSLKRKKIVKSKKAGTNKEAGPITRSRANAAVGNDKKLKDVATATKKQPKTTGINRKATSNHPPLVKPTCSKLFKQLSNCEEPGSVEAFLAMRARQKQNLAAPTMENVPELGEEGIETEEVEIVRDPRKPRGRSKMTQVHARGPDEKVVINVNEEGQPISDEQKTVSELSNFLGTLVKDNVSLTYINWHVVPFQLKNEMLEYTLARYVIPEEGHKWVMHTLNESWRRFKSVMKKAHYRKYGTDEERIENRPDTIPLEDFKMLLKYWGDESVKSLAEDNAARRNTLAETHTMGSRTHAQAKEKLKKDPKIAMPSDAEIYLETYKRDPERTYKTDTEELRTKYIQVQELVNAGKIAEANALVHGGKNHGRNWLVGRKGKKPADDTTPAAPSDQYVQELSAKIKQDLEADLEAKVSVKVKENMSKMLKKLGEANPGLKFDITDFCVTASSASSDQDDNGTPFNQGGSGI